MKIGIITVHRAYNYGSVLQCYALQEYLRLRGHDVWIIDYRQRWTEAVYRPFSLYYIWHFLKQKDFRAIIDYWRKREIRSKRLKQTKPLFESFMKRMRLTEPCRIRIPKGFDIYIIGSDQLWTHQCVGGEDKFYLGYIEHPSSSKVIGYSLSVSVPSIQIFGEQRLKAIISNFDKLSLREPANAELIHKLTGFQLPITIDPTLLVDVDFWKTMINDAWKSEEYIAIYQARPVVGNQNYLMEKASELSKHLNCKIVDLSTTQYTVEDFISIIKYAKYIMTTSYHATVFSLLMETPCYAIKLNDGLDVRYVDLLSDLGMESELFEKEFVPKPIKVNFDGLQERLVKYRESSKEYLTF